MQDPVTRVLTALEILQSKDRVTGAELADRLEVDLRTVQRYILRLRELNIPIEASPGVGGSYRLRPGFRLPPLLLTNEEAFALSLGLRSLRLVGLEAFAPSTEGALSKLERVLPIALQNSVRTMEEIIAIQPSSWMVSTPAVNLITAVSAIRTGFRLRFAYLSHQGKSSRGEVEPYAVLHTDERWYLIGHSIERAAVRTFRMDRMTQLEVTATTFKNPESFDAQQYLAERLPFVQSDHHIDVWIDVPIEDARHSFALWRVSMEEQGTGTRLQCGRDNLEFFAAMLLSTQRRIIVHSPAQLRETFRQLAQHASQAAAYAVDEETPT